MNKKLRLLKDWESYKKGSLIEVDEDTAKTLLESKSAEEYDEKAELKAQEQEKAMLTAAQKAAEQVVKAALDEYKKATPGVRIQVIRDESEQGFKSLGEQLQLVARAAKEGPHVILNDKRFMAVQARAKASGLNEAVDSEGGFLVDQPLQPGLWQVMWETAILAGRTETIEIGPNANGLKWNAVDETSRATGSRFGGMQCYWLDEAGTKTASKPKFRRSSMELEKIIGLCYATDELLQDSTALSSFMTRAFADETGWMIDDAIINGTGAGQPLGILASGCLVSQAAESSQTSTTIVAENIIKMYSRLLPQARAGAVWYINTDILPQLLTMSLTIGAGGQLVYMPAGGLSSAPYGTLFGLPVQPIEQCATLGTVGDIILANMRYYRLIRKGGTEMAQSIHVEFLTDQTLFRFVTRCNGQPMLASAITPANGSATLSPFVALATR